ncbi:MAG TPA: hypothetical protein VEP89_11230 [Draconibacterium sp.]|nr:hypothetical protein [Draconibacterium sp.]
MKKIFTAVALFVLVLQVVAKDINAWKEEKTLPDQYRVFKENLNFWNGSYFMKENQLDDFYGAFKDSVGVLENSINQKNVEIGNLVNDVRSRDNQLSVLQQQLDESLKLQNSIGLLGMNINKNVYSASMYLFIAGVLVLAGFVFLLYKRSLTVTNRTKKDYDELKEEYEVHKKNALDRYTKINMELHKTRMELNKR